MRILTCLLSLFLTPILYSNELKPIDHDHGVLSQAMEEKTVGIIRQEMDFDLMSGDIQARVSVTVQAKEDGAQLIAFGFGPIIDLRAETGNPKDLLLKTPGPLSDFSLVGLKWNSPLKKDEKRVFQMWYSFKRGTWAPKQGLYVPFTGFNPYEYKAVFRVPTGEIALCGPGDLISREKIKGGEIMTWGSQNPVYPNKMVLARRLFHCKERNIDFYLALCQESIRNAEAGLALIKEIYWHLVDLYGPLPQSQLLVYECDRTDGTVCNKHGAIEMKKNEFSRIEDTWLAGALGHEIAHDWWGGVVYGSTDNQTMIEAMADLSGTHYQVKKHGFKCAIDHVLTNTSVYLEGDRRPVAETKDRLYSKIMLVYRHLSHLVGEKTFFEAAREVLKRHKGKSVTHQMFLSAVEDVSKQKAGWLFDWLYHSDVDTDYSLSSIQWAQEEESFITHIKVVERIGRLDREIEVPIEVKTHDGRRIPMTARVGKEGVTLTLKTDSPVRSVALDPEWMIWDINRSNNFYGKHLVQSAASPGKRKVIAQVTGVFDPMEHPEGRVSLWMVYKDHAHLLTVRGQWEGDRTRAYWNPKGKDLVVEWSDALKAGVRAFAGSPPHVRSRGKYAPQWLIEAREKSYLEDQKKALAEFCELSNSLKAGDQNTMKLTLIRMTNKNKGFYSTPDAKDALTALLRVLKNPHPDQVRRWGFRLVRRIVNEQGGQASEIIKSNLPLIISALKDPMGCIRDDAALLLRSHPHPSAFQSLCDLVLRDESDPNIYAIWALEKLGDPRAAPTIIQALKSTHLWDRWNAAIALGNLADTRAIDPLIEALRSENPTTYTYDEKEGMGENKDPARTAYAEALHKLTGKELGKNVHAWMRWRKRNH